MLVGGSVRKMGPTSMVMVGRHANYNKLWFMNGRIPV